MDLRKRKEGVGGSDVAAILGLSRFDNTAVNVWMDKLSDTVPEEPKADDPKTSCMYWGKVLEPEILTAYANKTRNDIVRGNEIEQLQHPEFPWLIANIDGFAFDSKNNGEKILVEVKNCDFAKYGVWGEEWTDVIPIDYLYQVQHYLNVTGLNRADVAARINGILKIYSVCRDDGIINAMMPVLDRFWNYNVKQNIAPSAANLNDVKLIYPISVADEKVAEAKHLRAIDEIKRKQLKIKNLQHGIDDEKKGLAEYMGESNQLVANDGAKVALFKVRKDGVRVFRIS